MIYLTSFVWFLLVEASQTLQTNSFVVLYQLSSNALIIPKYKTRVFFFFINHLKNEGSLIMTHKFKHALYKHFCEN
jgi:hypothetical protein